jgi:hypothetical protein
MALHQFCEAGFPGLRVDQNQKSILAIADTRTDQSMPAQTLDPLG